jgi:hypothetical protein
MGKGLSPQQLTLLGLAVAVSRYRNGEPKARVPEMHPRWQVRVVTGPTRPDLHIRIAVHVLGGGYLRGRFPLKRGYVFLDTRPETMSARAALSRAMSSLSKRGHLAHHLANEVYGITDGLCLTASGLALGLPHEPDVPELGYRLWLLDDRHSKTERGEEDWAAPEYLPPPGTDQDRIPAGIALG